MDKKEEHFEIASYILGILSIVFSVLLQPVFGLGFGVTGLVLISKNKSAFSNKSRKLNITGVVISAVLMVVGVFFFINQFGSLNPLA